LAPSKRILPSRSLPWLLAAGAASPRDLRTAFRSRPTALGDAGGDDIESGLALAQHAAASLERVGSALL
jgi:hypothetical protein